MFKKDFKVENFIIDPQKSFSLFCLILKDTAFYKKPINQSENENEQKVINFVIEKNFSKANIPANSYFFIQ